MSCTSGRHLVKAFLYQKITWSFSMETKVHDLTAGSSGNVTDRSTAHCRCPRWMVVFLLLQWKTGVETISGRSPSKNGLLEGNFSSGSFSGWLLVGGTRNDVVFSLSYAQHIRRVYIQNSFAKPVLVASYFSDFHRRAVMKPNSFTLLGSWELLLNN